MSLFRLQAEPRVRVITGTNSTAKRFHDNDKPVLNWRAQKLQTHTKRDGLLMINIVENRIGHYVCLIYSNKKKLDQSHSFVVIISRC